MIKAPYSAGDGSSVLPGDLTTIIAWSELSKENERVMDQSFKINWKCRLLPWKMVGLLSSWDIAYRKSVQPTQLRFFPPEIRAEDVAFGIFNIYITKFALMKTEETRKEQWKGIETRHKNISG